MSTINETRTNAETISRHVTPPGATAEWEPTEEQAFALGKVVLSIFGIQPSRAFGKTELGRQAWRIIAPAIAAHSRRAGLMEAAGIAHAHIGRAAKEREAKFKPGTISPVAFEEIRAEERGEDIAATEIERQILAAAEEK